MHLYLDPACTYRISVRATFPGIMGQLVRFHLPMVSFLSLIRNLLIQVDQVLPCMAAALIMVLAFQLRRIEQDGTVKSTLLTLASCVSPVNVVLPRYYCTLHTAHCTLHTAHSTLHTTHYTLHTAHCTLHTAHSTLHTPHSTINPQHSTLNTQHSWV